MGKQYLIANIATSNGAIFNDFHDSIEVADTSFDSEEMSELLEKAKNHYFKDNETLTIPTSEGQVRVINCSQIVSVDLEVVSEEEFFAREEEKQKAKEKREKDQQNYENLLKDSRDSFQEFYDKVNNKN
ncbi:hypothetical protein WKW47_03385 [Staphylococcus nepalensis]|uniref:hypothetical protein n=1 Tax=Staphylococcus nepalensis TaxID=214473 RepID=UPI003F49AAD2